MSISRSFVQFNHRVDLYSKFSESNDMGQLKASWNLDIQNIPCLLLKTRLSTTIRIEPTTVEDDRFVLYLPHNIPVSYQTRLKGVRTRVGDELIHDNWLEVIQIDKEISFSGRIQFLQVKVKSVIE